MDYTLKDLTEKMGLPEMTDNKYVLYTYSQEKDAKFGGFAEIKLEDGGRLFSASLYHCRENVTCDDGFMQAEHEETVQIRATRLGNSDHFRIVYMELDGQEQHPTNAPLMELGLCVFHSRVVDIQDGMAEQTLDSVQKQLPEVCNMFKENMNFERQESTVVQFPTNRIQNRAKQGLGI